MKQVRGIAIGKGMFIVGISDKDKGSNKDYGDIIDIAGTFRKILITDAIGFIPACLAAVITAITLSWGIPLSLY